MYLVAVRVLQFDETGYGGMKRDEKLVMKIVAFLITIFHAVFKSAENVAVILVL